jgi:hypothetical protein
LELAEEKLIHAALSDNTHKTYGAAKKSYHEFCDSFTGKFSKDIPTVDSIAKWITYLGDDQFKGLAWSTINTYVWGMKSIMDSNGIDSKFLSGPRITKLLNGIAHTTGTCARTNRLPLTSRIFSSIVNQIKGKGVLLYVDYLTLAAMATGIYGLMRGGEFVETTDCQSKDSVLKLSQLKMWSYQPDGKSLVEVELHAMKDRLRFGYRQVYPDAITISLKVAKNDPNKKGTEVRICDPLGIHLIVDYLTVMHPCTENKESGLFIHRDQSKLTGIQLVLRMQEYLARTNIPNIEYYTLHSLRKGGAQSLRDMGASEEHIQLAGRWNSESAARLYSRQSLSEYILASRRIFSSSSN